MASGRDPAKRKKAAACSNLCLPRRSYAFLRAAFLHLSTEKSFLKNSIKRLLSTDLVKEEGKMKCLL